MIQEVIVIPCRNCGFRIVICRSCWRGQAYCSDACRESRQRRLHCQAERLYRQTENGKAVHRALEKLRRNRLALVVYLLAKTDHRDAQSLAKSQKSQPTMDDDTSSSSPDGFKVVKSITASPLVEAEKPGEWEKCLFCGQEGVVVVRFQRRDDFYWK
jgi:hypothetical protein